jgi:hypothetical protein
MWTEDEVCNYTIYVLVNSHGVGLAAFNLDMHANLNVLGMRVPSTLADY